MAWCYIELFGGLRVRVNGRLITRFRTRKTAALLAYLAYYHDRLHPREALVDLFWGDSELELGRNSLSKALSSLRQQMMPPAGVQGGVLYADRFYVGLRAEYVTTDVAEFETRLRAARRARSDAERITHLANAVQLYRGELLPEFDDEWVEPERARRAEQFANAVQALVNLYEGMGDLEQALYYARLAVTVDPLSELACERLMRLLLTLQQPAEALREFQEFRRRLTGRLGQDAVCFSTHLTALAREAERRLARFSTPSPHSPEAATILALSEFSPLPLGTVTLLGVSWRHRANGQDLAGRLQDLVRHHNGQLLKADNGKLFALFRCARWAAKCAIACRTLLPENAAQGVLDIVDLTDSAQLPEVLRHMEQLLAAVEGGRWLCSEATATVLQCGGWLFTASSDDPALSTLAKPALLVPLEDAVAVGETMATNLPPSVNCFFGRADELSQLRRALLQEGAALVTLVGLGGCGKTRLAVELGRQVLDAYQGRVWFVPLQNVADSEGLGGALARALGLTPSARGPSPAERALQMLAGQRCLLIWDAFEQVAPDGTKVLQAFMERLPMAQHLVTSRCPLGLPQERVFPLLPLPVPLLPTDAGLAASLDLEALRACPSVQMFVDRAQAVRPDFQLTDRTAPKVAAICARLEGFPLAIEIAAGWLASLSLTQIEDNLKRRLDFLQSCRRDIPARHRSLRTVLMMTWELLPPTLHRCLEGMSVFRGGATAQAVSAVTEMGTVDAADALTQLQQWGLVYCVENAESHRRFFLLDTVREFVAEQLSPDALMALRHRHAAFFTALAERLGNGVGCTAADWAQWLRDMETERDNLRGALEWAVEHEPPTALRLMRALAPFWAIQGTRQEAYAWAQRLHRRVADADPAMWAESCLLAANWALSAGEGKTAEALGKTALTLFERVHNTVGQAEAHLLLTHIAQWLGDTAAAVHHAQRSLALWRACHNPSGEAEAENALAYLAFRQGDLEGSRHRYTRVLHLCEKMGDALRVAKAKVNLAAIAWRQGDYATARALYEEVAAFWRVVNPTKLAGLLTDFGLIALQTGDYEQARRHYEAALTVRRAWGDRAGVGAALNGLASVAWRKGQLDEAERLFAESLAIFEAIGNRWGKALNLMDLGNVALLKGDLDRAETLLSQSLQMWQELDDRWGIATALRLLSVVAVRQGRVRRAVTQLKESLKLADAMGDKVGIIEGAETLAEIAAQMNNCHLAAQLLAVSVALRRQLKAPLPQVKNKHYTMLIDRLRSALGVAALGAIWQNKCNGLPSVRRLVSDALAFCEPTCLRSPNSAHALARTVASLQNPSECSAALSTAVRTTSSTSSRRSSCHDEGARGSLHSLDMESKANDAL